MTEPAGAAAVVPSTAADPATPATPSATDPAAELARVTAELEAWKGHSRSWETKAKANIQAAEAAASNAEQLAKVAAALGLAPDAKPDVDAISRQLETTKAEAKARAVELAVLRAAQTAGANGDELLDSRGFLNKVSAVDPNDLDAVKAAVAEHVAANPKFAITPPAAPAAPAARQASTAGQFDGQPGGPRQLGEADWKRMSPTEISEASKKGLFRDYLNS
jgi:hypothetical protein